MLFPLLVEGLRNGLVARGLVAGLQLKGAGNVGHPSVPPIGVICLGRNARLA